jgi:hypothetical protein
MGWPSITPSKRQPLRKNVKEVDRSDSYIKNQVSAQLFVISLPALTHLYLAHSFGCNGPSLRSLFLSLPWSAVLISSLLLMFSGQYDPESSVDYASRMKSTLQKSFDSPAGPSSASRGPAYSMGTSPRMTSHSSVLREGVLVSGLLFLLDSLLPKPPPPPQEAKTR